MRARLGLAVALHARPSLLLIDETLAVGDEAFRQRAILAVDHLRAEDVAVVFVSHDIGMVEEVCDRIVRLERGRVVDDGPAPEIIDRMNGAVPVPGLPGNPDLRLHPMKVARRRVVSGGQLEVHGLVEVAAACPTARLELAYLAHPPRGTSPP